MEKVSQGRKEKKEDENQKGCNQNFFKMYLFIFIGHTGQGKTTMANNLIKDKRLYVFDVNNEYPKLPNDTGTLYPRMRNVDLNMKKFISICEKLKGYNILIEDATGFLRGKINDSFSRLLVGKRHTKNNYLILFHSINRVPPEIMEMSNFIYLFKTNDNVKIIDTKFRNATLTNSFLRLQKMPKYSCIKIKTIEQ